MFYKPVSFTEFVDVLGGSSREIREALGNRCLCVLRLQPPYDDEVSRWTIFHVLQLRTRARVSVLGGLPERELLHAILSNDTLVVFVETADKVEQWIGRLSQEDDGNPLLDRCVVFTMSMGTLTVGGPRREP